MRAQFLFCLLASILLLSCKKETEEFETQPLTNYLPTQTGKYITYRLDSTVFTNFGNTQEEHSYQEKHQVDAEITDNLGRKSYRILRFIRDINGTTAWKPSGTYFITPTENTIEVIENNLRFVKLVKPIKEGNAWTGNKYLPEDPYDPFYDFNNDYGIVDWEYTYTDVETSMAVNGQNFPNTITVSQIDELENIPVTGPYHGYINYYTESYAKDLGLIHQEIKMWEYQPPGTPRPGYKGFGVKRSIIDHN